MRTICFIPHRTVSSSMGGVSVFAVDLSKLASPTVPLVCLRCIYKTVPYDFDFLKCRYSTDAMKPTTHVTTIILLAQLIPLAMCSCDIYLQEAESECNNSSELYSCAKYRVSKYVSSFSVFTGNVSRYGFVSLVDAGSEMGANCAAAPSLRQLPGDSELSKFVKFLVRQFRSFLRRQGLFLRLPDGARVLEDGVSEKNVRK